jgi:hypothetical protein
LTRTVTDHNYLKLGNPAAQGEKASCPTRSSQPEPETVAEDSDNPIANFAYKATLGDLDPGKPNSIQEAKASPECVRATSRPGSVTD